MDRTQYLERISYVGETTPHLTVLKSLQKFHLYHIPFENLDIHFGKKITLSLNRIFEKVIIQKRGGFCYELNGLFYSLLKDLGFKVKRISARVYSEGKGYGKEFDHLAIMCEIEHLHYLVDVGFGEFSLYPLEFSLEKIQKDPRGIFSIVKHDKNYFKVQKKVDETWTPEYIFSLKERAYQEFEDMCAYHQTSPESPFTQKKLCTKATESGRVTLLNDKLKIRKGNELSEQVIKDEIEFAQKLRSFFGFSLKKQGD